MAIHKLNKGIYIMLDIWRPIALLSMVGKIIKVMIVTHLRQIAEQHKILSEHQMDNWQNWLTEMTLNLLVN